MRRLIGITLLGLFAVAVTVYGQSPATRSLMRFTSIPARTQ
jgi:hypothetical protein